jgi:hypothetical protein
MVWFRGMPCLNFSAAMSKENSQDKAHLFEGWAFTKINYLIFGFGLALIGGGYLVMYSGTVNSFRSLSLAPVMLFLGYAVVIPAALIYRDKK